LKTLEDRVQFLIDLLEKCKTQLGYISDTDSHTDKSKAKEATSIHKRQVRITNNKYIVQ